MQSPRQSRAGASDSAPGLRLSGPLIIGLFFALIGLALAVTGIVRGMVPLNPLSIGLALLISAVSWGVVSWAIATATADVDADIAEAEAGEREHE